MGNDADEPRVSAGGDLSRADYSRAERSCDVVMKGGISSGVVYPHAVCELAQTYRFRNVGGTSAGAIAAAATAAAEYGRRRSGFNKLAELPDEIGAEGKLRSLFQPRRSTQRLFAVLIAAVEGGPWKGARTAAFRQLPEALFGAAAGLVLLGLAIAELDLDHVKAFVVIAGLVGLLAAAVGAVLGVVGSIALQAMRAVPDNGFGICSGGPGSQSDGAMALTPWLNQVINETAGLPPTEPLTFGHLWAGPDKERTELPENEDERCLQLAMMTTNLTNRRAHQLPWDSEEWFFDPDEFRRLFPEKVVKWMEDHPPQPPPEAKAAKVRRTRMRWALMRPLRPLPSPQDLPVLVATRMSLSFPVLLSAVPLWKLDMSREENAVLGDWRKWAGEQPPAWDPLADLPAEWPTAGQPGTRPLAERCWFSDGGISSNFPVHFFDRLVPRWPTFGINLRPYALGRKADDENQANNTWMVTSNEEGISEWWYRFSPRTALGFKDRRLFGFLSGIVRTMQNRVDEAQMRAPGYRDRVAHVNMSADEGGMNLTMPPPTIEALTARGRAAATRLHEAYTPPDPPSKEISWDNHRWVRLRSSLAVFEEMHGHFGAGYSGEPLTEAERTYAELLGRSPKELPKSYPMPNWEQQLAKREIDAILAAVEGVSEENTVTVKAPRPTPEGRISPRD